MTIAILSTTRLPSFLGRDHPDEAALFAEDDALVEAFAGLGVAARRVPWRREDADWSAFDLVLIRSTWDYIDDLPGFLRTLARIDAAGCRLVNPLETVRWNADKRYLAELARAGAPVVPTRFIEDGRDLGAALDALGEPPAGFVLKPTVGVGAYGTSRVRRKADIAARLAGTARGVPHMIQPFLDSVRTEGEWSFVFGADRYLYAALKTPAPGDFRVQVMYGAATTPQTPAPADLAAARACFDALPAPAYLARIDMARMPDGRLALMEAELIEPQLFLFDVPGAAGMVARATASLIAPG